MTSERSKVKRRVLLLMSQPPGGTGVQGLRYTKLFPYTLNSDWQLHFAGPSPVLTSVRLESSVCPDSQCHYTNNISWSTRFSTLKNRQPKGSLRFFLYGSLQLLARRVEAFLRHDSFDFLRRGLLDVCGGADDAFDFDLIAAKSPDFRLLELGAQFARQRGKPLLAIYDDPHGQRDEADFYPDDRDRQVEVLSQAAGALFMSPLTRERYVDKGLVGREKTFCLTDSFPLDSWLYQQQHGKVASGEVDKSTFRFVHLGNLPEWRPINPLLNALTWLKSQEGRLTLHIDLYGYLYPAAVRLIQSSPDISTCFTLKPAVGHEESHHLAERADVLLVMIGSRHLDNQPSKFFVYLGHHKPVLVIGPLENPIQALVNDLQIGVYCDVNNQESIRKGLVDITENYETYLGAFVRNASAIQRYGADVVAADLLEILNATMAGSGNTVT